MSTDKKSGSKQPKRLKKATKKEARHEIAQLLEKALSGIKAHMNEKKFKSSIKKASKLFVNAASTSPEKTTKKTPPVKKAAVKPKEVKK
ncbi:MAG: hypothetical protein BGO70_11035 [Bacteroidetes bacterium 43-93]|nr:hypothetical protein [Bacteroidota bacterium]OJW95648.1 MAG: hypothetical protein BGO70_11035 [Bacteroidetes bacterium 43-93]